MKKFLILLFVALPLFAQVQKYPPSDPNGTVAPILMDITFNVDKHYPFFGEGARPYANEYGIRLTDQDSKYTAYIFFRSQYLEPSYSMRGKLLRFYFPTAYYDYIMKRLDDNVSAAIIYKEYKDGHTWGEIVFDKYP